MASRTVQGYQIEPLHYSRLPEAAEVVRRALPDSVLAALGRHFLQELLASYITLPGGYAYICTQGDRVVGLLVGSEDSRRHRRLLMRQRWLPMGLRVAQGLVSAPGIVVRFLKYLGPLLPWRVPVATRSETSREGEVVPPASLVLLAVDPEHQRRGVGDRLSRVFLTRLYRRGVVWVKLAVGADNDGALSFYLSRGWRKVGRYITSEGGSAYRLVRTTELPADGRDRLAV